MAKMDLNGDNEKVNVETIFWSAMDLLADDDKKLPQASSFSSFWCMHVHGMDFAPPFSSFCFALNLRVAFALFCVDSCHCILFANRFHICYHS